MQLELVQLLVAFEDQVLAVIEALLALDGHFLQFADLGLETPHLALLDLFEVVLGFDFFVLGLDELLRVEQIVLDVLEMVLEDLGAVLAIDELVENFFVQGTFLLDNLIQLFVLFVGVFGKIGIVGIFLYYKEKYLLGSGPR